MGKKINKQSINEIWPKAVTAMHAGGPSVISDAVFTNIADQLRSAIEGVPHSTLELVERELKRLFYEGLANAPAEARAAVRGTGDVAGISAFALGQIAFAHLLAARTLDTRVDQAFLKTLEDKRYRKYLQALMADAKDGTELRSAVGEAVETVSRKLAVLRGRGIVSSRHEGVRVVNKLTPVAKTILKSLGIEPLQSVEAATSGKDKVVANLIESLPSHLQKLPLMHDHKKRKAA